MCDVESVDVEAGEVEAGVVEGAELEREGAGGAPRSVGTAGGDVGGDTILVGVAGGDACVLVADGVGGEGLVGREAGAVDVAL